MKKSYYHGRAKYAVLPYVWSYQNPCWLSPSCDFFNELQKASDTKESHSRSCQACWFVFIYLKHQPVTSQACSRSVEATAALPAPQTQLSYWTTGTFFTWTEMRPVLKQPKCLKSQSALCSSCLNGCAWLEVFRVSGVSTSIQSWHTNRSIWS